MRLVAAHNLLRCELERTRSKFAALASRVWPPRPSPLTHQILLSLLCKTKAYMYNSATVSIDVELVPSLPPLMCLYM